MQVTLMIENPWPDGSTCTTEHQYARPEWLDLQGKLHWNVFQATIQQVEVKFVVASNNKLAPDAQSAPLIDIASAT